MIRPLTLTRRPHQFPPARFQKNQFRRFSRQFKANNDRIKIIKFKTKINSFATTQIRWGHPGHSKRYADYSPAFPTTWSQRSHQCITIKLQRPRICLCGPRDHKGQHGAKTKPGNQLKPNQLKDRPALNAANK